MQISSAQAYYGLVASAEPTSTNVSGSVTIGKPQTSVRLAGANVAYSVRCILAASDDVFTIDLSNGSTSGSDTWTAGTAQVETATAAGTITLAGNASVVVTAAGMTGSPKTISVPVLLNDTAAQWAEKARTALAADAVIAALFTVGGTSASIVLTRKPTSTFTVGAETVNIYPANDSTLNISLDNGTCTGITTAATSANTTAGVATSGAKIYDGDGKDFEGVTLSAISTQGVKSILIQTSASAQNKVLASSGNSEIGGAIMDGGGFAMFTSGLFAGIDNTIVDITASGGPTDFSITVIGES